MHLRNRVAAGLLSVLGLLAGSAAAQEAAPTFHSETRLVVLHCSVVDKKGNLVTNLNKDDFKVFENNQQQDIRLFRREDIPISLGIIIDNSGSMRDKRAKVEAASLALVRASNPHDEVFIVNFNDDFFLDVPMTNELSRMEEGISRIDSKGGTAMRDALSVSLDYLKEEGKKDKKVLLVITDGNDNTSMMTLEKLVQKLHEDEVLLYAIGILSDESSRDRKRAQRALGALTRASGGVAYFPEDLAEVQEIALKVAKDIRNQYTIAYTPKNLDFEGEFRQVEVRTNNRSLEVRTRTGYYAKPEQKTDAPAESADSAPGSK